MEKQLELINEKLSHIDKTLAVNTRELSYHIEQTQILRAEVLTQRSDLSQVKTEFSRIKGFFMVLGVILTIAAGITTILYNISKIIHP